MFYSLEGILICVEPGVSVIECSGVGYKCFTSLNTQKLLPKTGEKIKLYTYLSVRPEAIELFGFISLEELNCFKMLISISGVGSRVGLAILSELLPEQVAMAVASSNSKMLTKAAGVGNKLAQRIILELKDNVKNLSKTQKNEQPINLPISASDNISKAIDALAVLGYTPAQISPVISKFDASLKVEELIRLSLKHMAGVK